MVGVPRSKGCRICVSRRVKCDQTRPTCNNCKKGNRPCPGYGQDLKFQDEGVRLRKRYEHSEPFSIQTYEESLPDLVVSSNGSSPGSDDLVQPISAPQEHWDVVGLDIETSKRLTFLGLLEGKRDRYLQIEESDPEDRIMAPVDKSYAPMLGERFLFENFEIPHISLNQNMFSPDINQVQLLSVFHSSMFPDQQAGVDISMRNHSRWLSHLPPLTGTNDLLDTAVRAVTLVHIGRVRNSETFIVESRPYYGKALRLLNSALMDPVRGMSNETLSATILLSFYEMFASDSNESWIRHAGGAGALMKMRGPARHRSGFDREIFLAYRYTLIIEAFQHDRPCFLDEPEWRELSTHVHNDIRAAGISSERLAIFNIAEEFYSVMVSVPTIFAEAQRLRHAALSGQKNISIHKPRLIKRLQHSRLDLKQTFARFAAELKKVGHSPTINISDDPVIGINFEFINTFVASSYTGYWTVLSVIDICLQFIEHDNPDAISLYQTENRESALNICRTTKFMLTSSFLGPFFAIFGLRTALVIFEDGGAETEWIVRKLFEIGDSHMSIAKHIPGFKPGSKIQDLKEEIEKARQGRVLDHREGEDPALLGPGQHKQSLNRTNQAFRNDIYTQ